MSRNIVPFGLRMQDELKYQVTRAAFIAGRSMNAEIVNRLKASFENKEPAALPISVQNAINDLAESTSCTPEEALVKLVLKGQSQGGTVLHLTVSPNTTMQQVRDAINTASELVPANSNIVFERETPK